MAFKVCYLSTYLPLFVLTFTTLSLSRGGEPPYYYGNNGNNENNLYSDQVSPVYSSSHIRPGNGYTSSDNSYNNNGYSNYESSSSYSSSRHYPPRVGYEQTPAQNPMPYENMGFNSQTNGNTGQEPQCAKKKMYVTKDQIIDIQSSVQYGAQLLDGMYAMDFEQCVSSCCEYNGCDLALFKADGMSDTGRTCYFIHCGLPEHCRMVDNPGFMASFLLSPLDYGDTISDFLDVSSFIHGGSETPLSTIEEPTEPIRPPATHTTQTHPTTTTSEPTTAATMPTEATVTSEASTGSNTETPMSVSPTTWNEDTPPNSPSLPPTTTTTTDATKTIDSNQTDDVVTTKNQTTSKANKNGENTSPTSTDEDGESTSDNKPTVFTPASTDGKSHGSNEVVNNETIYVNNNNNNSTGAVRDNKTMDESLKENGEENENKSSRSGNNSCGKNGCEGRGLIAVTIVGSMIILALLLISVVVVRRIYKLKRRKQYRNVDYLINGMYT